jgi:hypothetical protein
VAVASVSVQTLGMDPAGPPPVRTVSGMVPPGARRVILGLRVNSECLCSGQNDVVFGDFTYAQTGNAPERDTYSYLPDARRSPAQRSDGVVLRVETIAGQAFTRVIVAPNQSFGFNSPQYAVTAGAHFQLSVPIGSFGQLGMFGTATAIWLDANGNGLGRSNITVGADPTTVATGRTGPDGGFSLSGPANLLGPARSLRLYYPGSAMLRAAYGTLP